MEIKKKLEVDIDFAPIIIATCCVLHNVVEFYKEHFPEEWLQTVTSNAEAYPQPDPNDDCTIREPEDISGEIVRNALLQVSKQQSVLSSIGWQMKKY